MYNEEVRRLLRQTRANQETLPLEDTLRGYRRAYELAGQLEDDMGTFEAAAELGWALNEEDVTRAIEVQRRAVMIARAHPEWWASATMRQHPMGVSQGVVEGRLAVSLVSGGRMAEAQLAVRHVRELAGPHLADARRHVCEALLAMGQFEQAELLLTEMAYHHGAKADLSSVSEMAGMGEVYRMWGRPFDAWGFVDVAWHMAQSQGWRGLACRAGITRARCQGMTNEPTRNGKPGWAGDDVRGAIRTSRQVLDIAWQDGRVVSAVSAMVVLAQCHLRTGQVEFAATMVQDALDSARNHPGMPVSLKEEVFALGRHVVASGHAFSLRMDEDFDPVASYESRANQIADPVVRRRMLERNPWVS